MYVFTPNTLIESSKVNANFDEHTTELGVQSDRLDYLEKRVVASGGINSSTGTGVKTLIEDYSYNITFNGTNTYTVQVAGDYYMLFQQLVQTGASAVYLHIQKNSTTVRYGYLPNAYMNDVITTYTGFFNVGDTIRLYQQNTATSTWAGAHSSYNIFMVKGF